MKASRSQRILFNLVALIASVIAFTPVYLLVVNAFKDRVGAAGMSPAFPTSLNWGNFAVVIEQGKLLPSFLNSMLYASVATVLSVFLAAMAAYVLSRNRTALNNALYFFVIMGIAMPLNFVTLTRVMQVTGLMNTRHGIIILYAATLIPFSVFLIYSFIGTIPKELDEAAIVDGAGPVRLFWSVILPLLMPILVTTAVLNFMGVWNDFLLPLYYLNSSTKWPMTLAVYNFFGQFQMDWSLVSADILLTVLPVVVIYLLGQRYIIAGLTSGAVKG
jgi:raffinose/stachyose/melibiose transport system permease protein